MTTATATASRRRESSPGSVARLVAKILAIVLLVIYAIVSLYPFLTMLSGAVKTNREVLTNPLPIPFAPTLQTLADTFAALDFGSLLLNSLVIAGGSCLVILVVFPLAGYAFAVLEFPFKRILFASSSARCSCRVSPCCCRWSSSTRASGSTARRSR